MKLVPCNVTVSHLNKTINRMSQGVESVLGPDQVCLLAYMGLVAQRLRQIDNAPCVLTVARNSFRARLPSSLYLVLKVSCLLLSHIICINVTFVYFLFLI